MMIGMAVMLAPLVVLGVGSIVASQSMLDALDKVVRTEAGELRPVTDLQKLVLQAAMPPNDYLILGGSSERSLFDQLERATDTSFQALLASPLFEEADERMLINAAAAEWETARVLGREILAMRMPARSAAAGARMKVFDQHIDRTVDALNRLYEEIRNEIEEHRARAAAVRWRMTLFLLAVFAGAVVTAAAAGIVLSRSIILPIRALQDGVSRFSEGDHSFRVVMDRQDEFGRLASTLNLMAERLESDSLTGVYSRQEFERRLRNETVRAKRYGHEFSLLMLDLDHFKQVNDTYGHPGGDAALRAFAERVQRALRASDSIARYGGEEFAVIMPETGVDAARNVAERIRAGLASLPLLSINGRELMMTVSAGIATFPRDAGTEDDLIAAADHALYAAKVSGRDQVVSYHQLTGPGAADGP